MSGLLFLSLEFLLRVAIVGFLCFFSSHKRVMFRIWD